MGCLIPYYTNREQRVCDAGGCFLWALLHSPFFLPATDTVGPPSWGQNPGAPLLGRRGFSAFILWGPATLLTQLSLFELRFLKQSRQRRGSPFAPAAPERRRAAGPGRRTKAARSAGRAAGVGARLSGRRRRRRRRRRARACIPQKRPEPAGRRHPRLRPHPSQSKVTLD